jgi:DNA modification methylase
MPKQQPGWVKSTTTKNQLTVTWRDPKELIMYAKNSKLHPPEQIQQIANSIAEFGFLDPIAIDENGEILEGHGRYLAAVDILNLKSVPTFQVLGLTEEQKIAYRVAHNKLTMNTDFDPDLLKIDMDFLNEMSFDLTLTGFDSEDLSSYLSLENTEYEKPEKQENTIIDDATDKENTEELLEEVVENKIVSRVKLGEIWQLGRHFICCGDSTIESNVKALLGDNLAVLVHADPPYGMGKEKDGVMNDNLYGDKLDNFQMLWIKACRKKVEDNGSFYIWGNAEDLWRLWYSGGLKNSERLTFRNQIIWDKKHGQGMLSEDFRMYPTVTEHCLFFMLGEQGFRNNADNYWDGWESIRVYLYSECEKAKIKSKLFHQILGVVSTGGGMYSHHISATGSQWMFITEENYIKLQSYCQQNKINAFKREYDDLKREYDDLKREWYATRAYFNNTHDNMTDVWEYPRVKGEERWGHATPKPVDMIERIYKSSSPDNAVIYSPFLGSGTDVIAAQKMEGDRTVYGFELSSDYCEVIIQRFEKLTGIEAKLVGKLPTAPKDDTKSNDSLDSLGF